MKGQKPPTSSKGWQVRGRGDSDGLRDDSRASSTRDGRGVHGGRTRGDGRRAARTLRDTEGKSCDSCDAGAGAVGGRFFGGRADDGARRRGPRGAGVDRGGGRRRQGLHLPAAPFAARRRGREAGDGTPARHVRAPAERLRTVRRRLDLARLARLPPRRGRVRGRNAVAATGSGRREARRGERAGGSQRARGRGRFWRRRGYWSASRWAASRPCRLRRRRAGRTRAWS